MPEGFSLYGLITAIGVGLLIGVVRERAHGDQGPAVAGVRTHLLAALAGALAMALGVTVLVAVVVAVGALAITGYLRSDNHDLGLTGEMALLVTTLLAAVAQHHAQLAAGLSVVVAGALFAKQPLHRLVRERLSQQEVQDGLLLAAAALVVLPLLPDHAVDPWGVLVPARLWQLVVLILAVGMTGHVLLRLIGARWGLPLAGFLAGFASSTAAVAGFGSRARLEPAHVAPAAAGALFGSLGSLVLFAALVATAAPTLSPIMMPSLAGGGLALAAVAALGVTHGASAGTPPAEDNPRAFRLSTALLLVTLIAVLLLISHWVQMQLGNLGVLLAAAVVALMEVHAAGASLAQLVDAGRVDATAGCWGFVLLLVVSAAAKSMLAFASGGRSYGIRVTVGLAAQCAAVSLILLVVNINT